MVTTTREDETKVPIKYSEENPVFGEVSYKDLFKFNFNLIVTQVNN